MVNCPEPALLKGAFRTISYAFTVEQYINIVVNSTVNSVVSFFIFFPFCIVQIDLC